MLSQQCDYFIDIVTVLHRCCLVLLYFIPKVRVYHSCHLICLCILNCICIKYIKFIMSNWLSIHSWELLHDHCLQILSSMFVTFFIFGFVVSSKAQVDSSSSLQQAALHQSQEAHSFCLEQCKINDLIRPKALLEFKLVW